MKMDERIVEGYLISLQIGEVVYEPDGKVPPDFLVDGRVAVEVRRLNQHYESEGSLRGLEQDTIPLRQRFENLLAGIRHANPGTWFVMFNFRRPLADWRLLRIKLNDALYAFLEQPSGRVWTVEIVRGFTITMIPATLDRDRRFLLAATPMETPEDGLLRNSFGTCPPTLRRRARRSLRIWLGTPSGGSSLSTM